MDDADDKLLVDALVGSESVGHAPNSHEEDKENNGSLDCPQELSTAVAREKICQPVLCFGDERFDRRHCFFVDPLVFNVRHGVCFNRRLDTLN